MTSHRLTLAQQLAQLDTPAPIDLGREVIDLGGTEQQENDQADTREHYLEVEEGHIRKELGSILDPKYHGTRTSRKDMEDESQGERDEQDSEEEFLDLSKFTQPEESSFEESSDEENSPPTPPPLVPTDATNTGLQKSREEDQRKGKSVSRQIRIWDSLLDARIRIQKAAVAVNQLPTGDVLAQCLELSSCQDAAKNFLHEASALSEELFELQEFLMTSNESLDPPARKRRRVSDDATLNDYGAQFEESSRSLASLQHGFHLHLVTTLVKWSSKIQAVAPSVLLPSNRGAFSSKNKSGLLSAGQVIDQALSEHDKLLKRTRVYRGKKRSLDEDEVEQPDLFDDTDFYHLLLKDVIESRGESAGGNWQEVQRQKKAKKKVDTKASKGRKIRYEVHEKLQNFMVPIPEQARWHEEQIDELFASLLGQGFEHTLPQVVEEGQPGVQDVVTPGFRVFG